MEEKQQRRRTVKLSTQSTRPTTPSTSPPSVIRTLLAIFWYYINHRLIFNLSGTLT